MALLRFMIKDYLEDKELSGLAPRTIQSYGDTLNEFSRWLVVEKEIINIEDITPPVIRATSSTVPRREETQWSLVMVSSST